MPVTEEPKHRKCFWVGCYKGKVATAKHGVMWLHQDDTQKSSLGDMIHLADWGFSS